MHRLLFACAALCLLGCSTERSSPADQSKSAETPITSKSAEAVVHFKTGRELSENSRAVEAASEFEAALKLDPGFALAQAYYGSVMPDPEGLKQMEQANEKAAALPQAERLGIEAMLSVRRADFARSAELWKQLAAAAPGDWRSHVGLGVQLYSEQKFDAAIVALNKATELNPKAGTVYNMLGYAHLQQGEAEPAIDAFKRYVALTPNEPNPQDSLAEALMAGGRFAESEAAFRKALEISPKFGISWEGLAYTKLYSGDPAAGNDALDKARAAASRSTEKTSADTVRALAALGQGKFAEGMKQFDAMESSEGPVDKSFIPIYRAIAFIDASRFKDAVAEAAKVTRIVESGQLPPAVANNLWRQALMVQAAAQGRMGDHASGEKIMSALDDAAAKSPNDAVLRSTAKFANGMLAAGEKDPNAARPYFDECSALDAYCHWQMFVVSRTLKDAEGEKAARSRLEKMYVRDPVYLYARLMLKRAG